MNYETALTAEAQQRYAAALAKYPQHFGLGYYHADLHTAIHNLEETIQKLES